MQSSETSVAGFGERERFSLLLLLSKVLSLKAGEVSLTVRNVATFFVIYLIRLPGYSASCFVNPFPTKVTNPRNMLSIE